MSANLLQSAAVYGASEFVTRLIAFAAFPVYAYVFSVEEFGTFALISTATALLALFANLGISTAMQRFYLERDVTPTERKEIVTNGLVILCTWSAIVTALALVLFLIFRETTYRLYAIGYGLAAVAFLTATPGQILQYVQDVLRVRFLPWHFALIAALKSIVGVAIGLILVLQLGYRVEGLFLGQLIAATAAVPLALWLIRDALIRRMRLDLCQQMVAFGYPFVFGGLAYWLMGSLDAWMLGALSDAKHVGWYGIAARIALIMTFINSAFGQAWAPYALKIYAENSDYSKVLSDSFGVWLFALCILGSILSLFSYEMLWLFTPPEYWPAAPVLSALNCGMVMFGTMQITVLGLSLARQTRTIALCAWYAAAVHFLLNVTLIPVCGALGAGLSSIVSYSFLSGLYLYYSQRARYLRLDWRRHVPLLLIPFSAAGLSIVAGHFEWSLMFAFAKIIFVAAILAYGWKIGILRRERLQTAMAAILGRGKTSA